MAGWVARDKALPIFYTQVAESDLLSLPVLNGYEVEIVQRRDTPRELPRQGEE